MEISFPARGVFRLPLDKQVPVVTDDGREVGQVVRIEAHTTFSEVFVRVDDFALKQAVQDHIEFMRPVLHIFLPAQIDSIDMIFSL